MLKKYLSQNQYVVALEVNKNDFGFFNEKDIEVINDVRDAFPLMNKLAEKNTYVLLENDLPDLFNE